MKKQDYWNDRFTQLELAQLNKGADYYANLEKQYNSAIANVEKDLSKWYTRYATENGITMAEAKKQLSKRELAEFKMSVEEYIEKGRTLKYSNEWADALEKASVRFHVSRLEALKLQMQQQIEFLGAVQNDGMTKMLKNVYTDGYYKTAFEIQKGLGVGHDFMKLDSNTVNKVIARPWAVDGRNFSSRIWENKSKLVNELNNTLAQSIARGSDPKEIINAIAKRMNVSKSQAGRLVMTELAFFSSESSKDSMLKLGVEKYQVLSTLDSRTSEICRDLDGKVFEMKNFQAGVTAPPFHPHCRTTTVPYFEDEMDGVRASRDENDKGYYKVPENMNYREWEKTFVDGGSKKDLTEIKPDDLKAVIENKPKDFAGSMKDLATNTSKMADSVVNLPNMINSTNAEILSLERKIQPLQNEVNTYNTYKNHNFKSELETANEELKRLQDLNARNEAVRKRYYNNPTENMTRDEKRAFRQTKEYQEFKRFRDDPATQKAVYDYDTASKIHETEKLIKELKDNEDFVKNFDKSKEAKLKTLIKELEDKKAVLKGLEADKIELPKKISENVHKAGKSFIKELKKVHAPDKELLALETEINTLLEKAKKNHNKLSHSDYVRYKELLKLVSDKRFALAEKQSKEVTGLLKQFRSVGVKDSARLKIHLPGNSQIKKYVESAYEYYPSEWIEKSFNHGSLKLKKTKRGYYSHYGNELAVSGSDDYKSLMTAIHELGHRFEYVNPIIRNLEKVFYDRRTAGEVSKWLGSGFAKNEVTKKDNFINPYIGKDYGDNTYEIVSMGFERAFMKTDELLQDEDYAEFIFGVLSLL